MLKQLFIGSNLIVLTLIIQVAFVGVATSILNRTGKWLAAPPLNLKMMFAIACVVLWLLAGISINAWIWAGLFVFLEAFNSIETAVYFSIVTMTTLGFGDIVLTEQWRLLSALTAVNGLIIFGLNTAFLAEFIFILRKEQLKTKKT